MVVVDPNKIARAILDMDSTIPTPAQTNVASAPKVKPTAASPEAIGGSEPSEASPPEASHVTEPIASSPPTDPTLFTIRNLGRTLDDIERLRIMNGNRVGAGQRAGIELPWMDEISERLDALEHQVELQLKRAWRKHPLAAWAKTIPGAGEVLMGRLIAEIGDPADRPNPAKLLAYCGHGDPERAGQVPKGATQEELFKRGNPAAKKAVWKLAYQFMRTVGTPTTHTTETTDPDTAAMTGAESRSPSPPKSATTAVPKSMLRSSPRSPYRDIYEQRKAATEGKLHAKPCKRCGPSGHPAAAGSPWSDAHRHADALRVVGKRFLIDLWVEATTSRGTQNSRNPQV